MPRDYRTFMKDILIPEEELQARVTELGAQISHDYRDKGRLLLLCILRGGVVFLTDLMRKIHIPHEIEFMAVSSYGAGVYQSSGQVRLTLDLRTSIEDANVILVEDIIDSGHTIASVLAMLSERHPKSLAVCALLDKAERREVFVPIRYVGFSIPNEFVFGYGLDIDEYYRNLPFIGTVDLEKFKTP